MTHDSIFGVLDVSFFERFRFFRAGLAEIFVKIKSLSNGAADSGKAMANRMKFYPLVLVVCHFAGIFVFFFELFGGTGAFGLSLWTVVVALYLSSVSMLAVGVCLCFLSSDVYLLKYMNQCLSVPSSFHPCVCVCVLCVFVCL